MVYVVCKVCKAHKVHKVNGIPLSDQQHCCRKKAPAGSTDLMNLMAFTDLMAFGVPIV